MNIGLYISELLYEHDFVVLPGIGEFSTKYVPARFIPEERKIESPTKISHFNADCISQESLLAGHIAQKERKSIFEAKQNLEGIVRGMQISLDTGQRVVLDKLGVLFKGADGKLTFEPDRTVNYLPESAGLGVISEPVKHSPVDEDQIIVKSTASRDQEPFILRPEKKPDADSKSFTYSPKEEPLYGQKPEKSLRQGISQPKAKRGTQTTLVTLFVWLLVPITILAIFLVFNWRFIVDEIMLPIRQIAGVEAVQPPQEPAEEPNAIIAEDAQPTDYAPDVAADPPAQQRQPVTYDPAKQYFYIVVGSFQHLDVANQLVNDINKRSPGMARVFMQTPDGFHRVSYGFYLTENDANAQLSHVKESVSQGAWILYH